MHRDQVDDAGEPGLAARWGSRRPRTPGRHLAQRVQGGVEVGALAVEHVDDDGAGEAGLLAALPQALGRDLHPGLGVDDHQRAVARPDRRESVSARNDDSPGASIRLISVPRHVEVAERRGDAHAAALLVVVEVADRAAVGRRCPCGWSRRRRTASPRPGSSSQSRGVRAPRHCGCWRGPGGPWLCLSLRCAGWAIVSAPATRGGATQSATSAIALRRSGARRTRSSPGTAFRRPYSSARSWPM